MKGRGLLLFLLLALASGAPAAELRDLKVIYIGNKTERSEAFTAFLSKHAKVVEKAQRTDFDPSRAASFDVVLLDWQQNEGQQRDFPPTKSPLGEREKWAKPTVLLGSAGLHMAIVWKLKGGSG
jgi:hypothetical protein